MRRRRRVWRYIGSDCWWRPRLFLCVMCTPICLLHDHKPRLSCQSVCKCTKAAVPRSCASRASPGPSARAVTLSRVRATTQRGCGWITTALRPPMHPQGPPLRKPTLPGPPGDCPGGASVTPRPIGVQVPRTLCAHPEGVGGRWARYPNARVSATSPPSALTSAFCHRLARPVVCAVFLSPYPSRCPPPPRCPPFQQTWDASLL